MRTIHVKLETLVSVLALSMSLSAGLPACAQATAKVAKPANTAGVAKGHEGHRGMAPCMTWINPDVEPTAAILCVHGLGLHNGSYRAFGERMASKGVATYAVDVRGFGSWQQAKGRAEVDFEECLEDVRDTLKVIRRAHPGLPVFILGESMGGAIALRVTAKYPELVDGLISCVPSGDRFRQKKTELRVAMRLLHAPNKKIDVGTDVIHQATEGRSGDVNEQQKESWLNDPLARLSLSPKELLQFQRFMNENHDSARQITRSPVLMVQGWEDNLVKWEGTLELWKEVATDDKQIELVPAAKHLIFEESQFNDQALNEKMDKMVLRWMEDHIKKPANATKTAQPLN
jgi:alpha-beta hydrolase superfamily lysophospholipase